MPWSAIAALGSNLLGAGVSAYANHREADLNREFQERMAKNKYQYAVTDLKAAGLNPALAYGNLSASVPSGSQAAPTDFSKAFDIAQLKLIKAQEDLAKQQAQSNAKQADARATLDLATAREVNAKAKTEEHRNAYYEGLSPAERTMLFNTRESGGSTAQQVRAFAQMLGGFINDKLHGDGSDSSQRGHNSLNLSREEWKRLEEALNEEASKRKR